MTMQALLSDQTSNTTGDAVRVSKFSKFGLINGLGGETFSVIAGGTFDGATVKLQVAPTDSGPWLDVDDVTFTDIGLQVSPLSRRAWVRPVVSGAGGSTSVSLWVG